MNITPIPSTANIATAPLDRVPETSSVQKLRMRTNYNPSIYDPDQAQSDPPIPGQELPTNNDQANGGEETQPLSPQYAALARQRRALDVKERALKEREKALSSNPGQGDSIAIARLKSEPLNVLLEAGVTYDQLTEAILANQANPQMSALEAKMKALEEGLDKKLSDRETAAEKQALAEMRRTAQDLIAQGEDFELVRGTNSVPDVMRLIERTYRETGDVLDVKDACQLVEDELFKEAQKMAGLNKVRAQFAPQAQQMQRHQGMRTLTNRDTASVPMSPRARALAAFNGTLKR